VIVIGKIRLIRNLAQYKTLSYLLCKTSVCDLRKN